MAEVDRFLKMAYNIKASDVHFCVGARPTVRLNGILKKIKYRTLTADDTERMIMEILDPGQKEEFLRTKELDISYESPTAGRCRTNVCIDHRGMSATFRLIPEHAFSLDELGFPPVVKRLCDYRQGMILVTGQGGCGKTTTLGAMVDYLNNSRHDHIITLEDPVEILHTSKDCHIIQREVGRHTASFGRALRACLREDPDIILVGEMRDLETISMAITAAETGHLVLATLHTTSAPRTINRVLDVFPPSQQGQIRTMLAESLRGIISQQLVPAADGKGRIVALEILVATPAIANLIREDRGFQIPSQMQTGVKLGMRLMDDSLYELLQAGIITPEIALERCFDRTKFTDIDELRREAIDWDQFKMIDTDKRKKRILIDKKAVLWDRKKKEAKVVRKRSVSFNFYMSRHGRLPVDEIYAEVIRLFPEAEEKAAAGRPGTS